jgi:hypothetical protein
MLGKAESNLVQYIRWLLDNLPDVIPYDPTHALIICLEHGYTDGLVLLWEHLDASGQVVSHLKKYGHQILGCTPLCFGSSHPARICFHDAKKT